MDNTKEKKTPMHSTSILGLAEESEKVNLIFVQCMPYERFQTNPRNVHLTMFVKRIFRYFIGTNHLDLCFEKKKDFRLVEYCD